uniref:Uncharacterized protein n=1 Tax=Lentinula edodes TaxID=5353 RepID=I7GYF1_LENED|nr:hypothetical protein [Lentinula edodes]
MRSNFNNIWKYVAGGGTVLGYQAWWDRMSNKSSASQMKSTITNVDAKLDIIKGQIDHCPDSVEKARLLAEYDDVKSGLKNLGGIHNRFFEKAQGLSENSEESKTLFNDYNDKFKAAFDKVSYHAEELEKSVNKIITKFMDDNSIIQKINEFKDYLATLSSTEICLVMNISISVFILTCLVSIIFAVYGNFLVEKFSLETKYPKLSKIINLRVKLQHLYIITNTLFIVASLILMFFVNLITLMYG